MRIILLAALVVGVGTGCVSKAEHQKALDEAAARLKDRDRQVADLERQRAELQRRLQAKEGETGKLSGQLAASAAEVVELKRAREMLERRTRAYRELMSKFRAMIDAGTLSVKVRKGRLIVQLSDKVLFDPGKTDLKPGGKKALEAMAKVLKTIDDRDFLIAGHTDNKPVKASHFKSNWQLSTARALQVVEFLEQAGVDAAHLGAAGYSQNDPVAKNQTEKGRAQNRRIEIILMPQVAELPQIVE